jgi:glycolate oxidase iron-sulfur subunit
MQTSFTSEFMHSTDGERVNQILRKCVHCGFCNATCPTYQLTGDELDGPRGRIYLIKNFFEDQKEKQDHTKSTRVVLKHLDRCLTCLACETTCPSGVKYGELVDLGRKHIHTSVKRPLISKFKRKLILFIFSNSNRVTALLSITRIFKLFLPPKLVAKIPTKSKPANVLDSFPHSNDTRKMLTIKGCVQSVVAPEINLATKKVLKNSDIQIEETQTACCGALAFHLTELEQAQHTIHQNIDDWYKKLKNGYDNIIINSSGCSSFIKQYGTIMQDDNLYAEKAKFISDHCIDLSELAAEIKSTGTVPANKSIAFHSPCTLQHGQNINGIIEQKLIEAGYKLLAVQDGHLCCGSAGTYSLLEENLSTQLLKNKISNLEKYQPDLIVTANFGCMMHLQSATEIPVKHWAELLA